MSVELISICAFVAAAAVVLLVIQWWGRHDDRIEGRVEDLRRAAPSVSPRKASRFDSRFRSLRGVVPRIADRLMPNDEQQRLRIQSRLIQAGYYRPSSLHLYLVAKPLAIALPAACGVAAALFGWCDMRTGLLLGGLGAAVGVLAPGFWLESRKSRRHVRFSRSLPDFLDLLVTCMEGGLSFEAALKRVTREMRVAHPELAAEMERVEREMELGTAPDAALKNLGERSDLDAFGMLGSFVQQARKFGTSMGDALRVHAEGLRIQREHRAEELAQKASVKILFPTLLFIFPAVFVVLAGPAAIQLAEVFSPKATDSPLVK
ncbi:MAG: type II secretion system F family protein [Planctomycetaceae bacterium]